MIHLECAVIPVRVVSLRGSHVDYTPWLYSRVRMTEQSSEVNDQTLRILRGGIIRRQS